MSPEAKAAKEAFHATFRESGRAIKQATLELAWERAAKAAVAEYERARWAKTVAGWGHE